MKTNKSVISEFRNSETLISEFHSLVRHVFHSVSAFQEQYRENDLPFSLVSPQAFLACLHTPSVPLLKLYCSILTWSSLHLLSLWANHLQDHLSLRADFLSRAGPPVQKQRFYSQVAEKIWD